MSSKLNQMLPNASSVFRGVLKPKISKVAAGTIVLTLYCICSVLIYWRTGITPYNFHDASKTSDVFFFNMFGKSSGYNNTTQDYNIALNDIFFSIRIKNLDRNETLLVILKTWFQLARNQTWIFTDADFLNRHQNSNLSHYLNSLPTQRRGHVVVTNCSDDDDRKRICCIITREYQYFNSFNRAKKWFCSFEDDHYVNVPRLLDVLKKYSFKEDWYLGRDTSGNHKEVEDITIGAFRSLSYSFSAGMCMTRTLLLKLHPVTVNGLFTKTCENTLYSVDGAIRNITSHSTNTSLTALPEFHSNHDSMNSIPKESFRNQISLSYSQNNVLNVPGFNEIYDPTRFFSLHCYLFPHFEFCKNSRGLKFNLFG